MKITAYDAYGLSGGPSRIITVNRPVYARATVELSDDEYAKLSGRTVNYTLYLNTSTGRIVEQVTRLSAAKTRTLTINTIRASEVDEVNAENLALVVRVQTVTGSTPMYTFETRVTTDAVWAKYAPALSAPLDLVRITDGDEDDEGVSVRVKNLSLGVNVFETPTTERLRLYYADSVEPTEESEGVNIDALCEQARTGGIINNDTIFSDVEFSNGKNWNFLLVYEIQANSSSAIERLEVRFTVVRAFANVHLSSAVNGGVCFGGFSKATDTNPIFECYYPARFYNGIEGVGAGDYSTEEQDTGSKWIDGKPIYSKTFVKTALKTVSSATNADIATISGMGIETVIEMKGICKQSSGANHPIPGWYSSDNFRHPYTSQDGQYLRLRHNEGSTSATMDVYITMYYTKT